MRTLLLLVLALMPAPRIAWADSHLTPHQLACGRDNDCTIARAPCGERRPVNLRSFTRVQGEWNRIAALVECERDEGAQQPPLKPLCGQDNLCIVMPDITED